MKATEKPTETPTIVPVNKPIELIDRTKIDITKIITIPAFPADFEKFCKDNELKYPSITSKNGKALSIMVNNANYYFTRESSDEFAKKFKITTKDSIQLFNKHEQWVLKPVVKKENIISLYLMLYRINIRCEKTSNLMVLLMIKIKK